MRKAVSLYPGACDYKQMRCASGTVDTACTMPHTLRAVERNDDVFSALKILYASLMTSSVRSTITVNPRFCFLIQIFSNLVRVFAGSSLARTPVPD